MFPDEPTDEEKQEQLAQDSETPFRPADPAPNPSAGVTNDPVTSAQGDSQLDDTHPATDTNVQPEEQYDEGVSGAAEAQEPNAGNAVVDFDPQSTQDPAPDSQTDSDETVPDAPTAPENGDDGTVVG